MKRYLPFVLLLAGVLVVIGASIFVKSRKKAPVVEEEETSLIEVELENRPIASLTPTQDGHYLNLKVEKIRIPGAESMDYELIYKTGSGLTQGVPGMFKIDGQDSFAAELLLGSESSGKFRYDEGVEEGTLTLRFRNGKGKLLIKFGTDFHLQTKTQELTSLDGKFTYTLDQKPKSGFFVVMETFGIPEKANFEVGSPPYGVFSHLRSASNYIGGQPAIRGASKVYYFDDRGNGIGWVEPSNVKVSDDNDIGFFVGMN